LESKVKELANDTDPNVVLQAVGLAKRLNLTGWELWARGVVATSSSKGVQVIGKAMLTSEGAVDHSFSPAEVALLKKGDGIYKELCIACHGPDGKGTPLAGGAPGATLAPPLSGSKTVNGHRDGPLLVLLHGLSGPVNGKAYDAPMVSMAANPDEWIAAIASYVRVSFNNKGGLVSAADVKRLRATHAKRTESWTEATLRAELPAVLKPARDWKLTASHKPAGCDAAADGKPETRWDTAASQAPGQWFQVELPAETKLSGLRLDAGKSVSDFPRGYQVQLSGDGKTWSPPVAEGKGSGPVTDIVWQPANTRFVRITQTGSVQGKFWSISEFELMQSR
jgi:mono/diheme cytochrome c family protein